jgi:two-component system sensor histidine kinase SenX3
LAIVKHVVNNHKGEVRVWSQLGKGSTFTIRLRQAPANALTELSQRAEVLPVTPKKPPRPAEYLATDEIPQITGEDEETEQLKGAG